MKCIAVIEIDLGGVIEVRRDEFDTRPAALNKMREMATAGEHFSFELYEQVLVGTTVCQLETSPPKEVPQDRPDAEVEI